MRANDLQEGIWDDIKAAFRGRKNAPGMDPLKIANPKRQQAAPDIEKKLPDVPKKAFNPRALQSKLASQMPRMEPAPGSGGEEFDGLPVGNTKKSSGHSYKSDVGKLQSKLAPGMANGDVDTGDNADANTGNWKPKKGAVQGGGTNTAMAFDKPTKKATVNKRKPLGILGKPQSGTFMSRGPIEKDY